MPEVSNSSSEEPVSVEKPLPENYWVLGGVIIVGGIIVGTLYFMQRGASPEFSPPKVSSP